MDHLNSLNEPAQSSIEALVGLCRSGRLAEAEAEARELLRDFPGDLALNDILAGALAGQGKFQEAIPGYRKVIEIMPAAAEAHCNLGHALAQTGQFDEAVESFRAGLGIRPDFAEAHNNLGMLLKEMGNFDGAEASFKQAIEVNPGFVGAYNNLAFVLRKVGKLEDSATICRTALEHDPRSAEAHYNLGAALQFDGQLEAAIDAYNKALELNPNISEAQNGIGGALQSLGRFAEAITCFDAVGNKIAKAWALECCYALGRVEEYNQRLDELCRSDATSIRVASVASFVAHQWGAENPHPFCKNPLDFIHIKNVQADLGPFESFSAGLLKEIENLTSAWAPPGNTTVNGYHTIGNLFHMRTPKVVALHKVIARQIDQYRSAYAGRPDAFIKQWPKQCNFNGWHVKILKSGDQELHNHPTGWLSGVLYLKMPENLDPGQGAITFTLHGRELPILKEDIPSFRHSPKEGDLVLFPSSLFHYTSPFDSDADRQCVAFDLCPM